MDLKEHERWNDEMARKYNPDAFITKTGPIIRWVEGRRMRSTLRALEVRSSDAVLDLGCGPGNLLPMIGAQHVVGVDPSDSLLRIARTRTQNHPEIQLIKAFAEKLPFADHVFDRIVCSEVMEHVRNPEDVIREMKRVAKPDARIVITVPNEDLINLAKRWVIRLGLKKWMAGDYQMSDNMLEEWHVTEVTEENLKRFVGRQFKLEQVIGVPFSRLRFHRIFVFQNLG